MKKLRRNWLPVTAVFVGVSIITILLAMYLFNSSILKGSIAAIYSFKDSKTQSREETYNDFYLKGYEIGEENNHVSNVCNITIEDIKEKADLQVLQVKDVVFIDNKEGKDTVWLEADGASVFTVNLKAGDYIIDNNRHYVLVRVPCPELNPESVEISNTRKLKFEEAAFKSSTKEGVKLGNKLTSEAKKQVIDDFTSNQEYYSLAKKSAEKLIKELICSLNFDVDDLIVEVDFYDEL